MCALVEGERGRKVKTDCRVLSLKMIKVNWGTWLRPWALIWVSQCEWKYPGEMFVASAYFAICKMCCQNGSLFKREQASENRVTISRMWMDHVCQIGFGLVFVWFVCFYSEGNQLRDFSRGCWRALRRMARSVVSLARRGNCYIHPRVGGGEGPWRMQDG